MDAASSTGSVYSDARPDFSASTSSSPSPKKKFRIPVDVLNEEDLPKHFKNVENSNAKTLIEINAEKETETEKIDWSDKEKVCSLIMGGDEISAKKRREFLETFHFSSPLLSALRLFLSSFILLGETQQQDRILYAFSSRYHDCTKEFTLDVTYQLVYSAILLNTDLHALSNTRRMTVDQYIENTISSLDLSEDESVKYRIILEEIYESVAKMPIMQPPSSTPVVQSSASSIRSVLRNMTIRKKKSISSIVPSVDTVENLVPLREGILVRKQVMESKDRRAFDRKWHSCYCKVVASDLLIYNIPSNNFIRSHAQAVAKTKLSQDLQLVSHIPLRHALASPLPKSVYSPDRPFLFQLILPDESMFLFQTYSESSAREWASTINYWAALESREPLTSGIGVWFGTESEWILDFIPGASAPIEADRKQYAQDGECKVVEEINSVEAVRSFESISDRSIAVFRLPLLPFVPSSKSSQVEEVTLKSNSGENGMSRLYHPLKPLGYDFHKIISRHVKLKKWEKRAENLAISLERLIYSREILRCVGIGRGVVDATVQDEFIGNLNTTYESPVDFDKVVANDAADTVLSGNELAAVVKTRLSKHSSSTSNGQSSNATSINPTETWKVEIAPSFYMVPANTVFLEDHKTLCTRPRQGYVSNTNENNNDKSFTITIPAPVNLTIRIPPLPEAIIQATISDKNTIPNFTILNPKLAQRIDQNWHEQFHFMCHEFVKAYRYIDALENGVEMSQSITPASSVVLLESTGTLSSTTETEISHDKLTSNYPPKLQKKLSYFEVGTGSFRARAARSQLSTLSFSRSSSSLYSSSSNGPGGRIFGGVGSAKAAVDENERKLGDLFALESGIGIESLKQSLERNSCNVISDEETGHGEDEKEEVEKVETGEIKSTF